MMISSMESNSEVSQVIILCLINRMVLTSPPLRLFAGQQVTHARFQATIQEEAKLHNI